MTQTEERRIKNTIDAYDLGSKLCDKKSATGNAEMRDVHQRARGDTAGPGMHGAPPK